MFKFVQVYFNGLSTYKALLYLNAHIEHLAGRNSIQKPLGVTMDFVRWYTGKPMSLIISDIKRWEDEEGIAEKTDN